MIVITVARKPIPKGVVDNVVQWGTGTLNIETSRIQTEDNLNGGGYTPRKQGNAWAETKGMNSEGRCAEGSFIQPSGRWPSNAILEHKPECFYVETVEIQPKEGYRPNPVNVQADGNIQFSKKSPGYQKISYTQENGMEAVEKWDCVNGCPVRQLDVQSGTRPGMPIGTGPKEYGGGGGFEGML